MFKTPRIFVMLIMLALASVASAQSTEAPGNGNGNGPSENSKLLTILSAQPDSTLTFLHVEGRHFCDFPAVMLGGSPLAVQATTTSTSFDALLPVGIASGSFRLEVSCGNGAVRNDSFVVTITATP